MLQMYNSWWFMTSMWSMPYNDTGLNKNYVYFLICSSMSFYLPFRKIKLFLSQRVINRKNSFRSECIIFNVLTMILYFVLFNSIYSMQPNVFSSIGRKKNYRQSGHSTWTNITFISYSVTTYKTIVSTRIPNWDIF